MEYKNLDLDGFDARINAINSNDTKIICESLIYLGLHADSTKDVEDILVEKIFSTNYHIASAALISIAHLARRNKDIDLDKFINLANSLPLKNDLKGIVDDVVDDIKMFSKRPPNKS